MSIEITCQCGVSLWVSSVDAGRRAKCPSCGKEIVIPSHQKPEERNVWLPEKDSETAETLEISEFPEKSESPLSSSKKPGGRSRKYSWLWITVFMFVAAGTVFVLVTKPWKHSRDRAPDERVQPEVLPAPETDDGPSIGEIRQFKGHTDRVTSVAFSPDDKIAITGSADATIRLWDVSSGQSLRLLAGHTDIVASVCISSDGHKLVSSSWDETVRLWDIDAGIETKQIGESTKSAKKKFTLTAAFTPDDRLILIGDSGSQLVLFDPMAEREVRRLKGHTDAINSVAFSTNGRRAVSGSSDHTVRLWDVNTGAEQHRIEGHTDVVSSVAFSPDGRRVLSGSSDRTLRLWDVNTGKELVRFEGHTDAVMAVVFLPDGTRVLSASADKTVRLWSIESGIELHRFEGHTRDVTSVAISSDGRRALSGSADKTVRLWALPD